MTADLPHGVVLCRHDATSAGGLIEQLGDVYEDARAEAPYNRDPDRRWQREGFLERTRRQATNGGFVLIAAKANDDIIGFAFGLPIEAGRWFDGDTEPPSDIKNAPKFAVIELNVRRAWRSRGIGRALLDALLYGRSESYAILSSLPGTQAHAMYQRWGWRIVVHTKQDSGLPPWDTLALALALRDTTS